CVALREGDPLSVTRTAIVLVPGAPWPGVQVNTPLLGLMLAPEGPATRLNGRGLAGRSGSGAAAVRVRGLPSLAGWFAMGVSTGGLFTSLTVTVKLLVSLKLGEPLSVTRTLITFVLGPCASVGVQVNMPVTGLMAAPAGGEIRVKVSVLAGRSGSV